MSARITLDMLSQRCVSVKTQETIEHDGKQIEIGYPERKAYMNSLEGRKELETELPEPYKTAVLSVWGKNPVVVDHYID